MKTSTDDNIYRVLEIRYDANGQIYACTHDGWTVTNYPEEPVQIRIFSRDKHRIKVVVYQTPLEHIETFGTYLCRALLNDDGYTWRHIDLRSYDR